MNWCLVCGESTTDSASRCKRCASGRQPASSRCQVCRKSIEQPWTTCEECAGDRQNACNDCGAAVSWPRVTCAGCAAPPVLAGSMFSAIGKGVGIALMLFLGAVMVLPMFANRRHPHRSGVVACKSNLKNIGTGLEMYSTDNAGRFPSHLASLTPEYLKVVPTCPSTGTATYLQGFVSTSRVGATGVDAYTVVCAGANHTNVSYSENYPQYTSHQGLLER